MLNWWLKEPSWWREEARKSWDYILTDELVYISQSKEIKAGWRESGYTKHYLKGKVFLEIHFGFVVDGNVHLGLAVIECHNPGTGYMPHWCVYLGTSGKDDLMFVYGGDMVQNGQGVLTSQVPTVVRLKFLDDFLSGLGHVFNHRVQTSVISRLKQWESGSPVGFRCIG